MEGLLDAWRSWTPHAREAALIVRSQELVNLIDGHMRVLWQSEIQAQQFGVKGAMDPFDHAQLPLLSTMQFDHTGVRVVKWPREACENPELVVNALLKARAWARGVGLAADAGPRRLHERSWNRLLANTPTSWTHLEYALAQLIEQLLLVAQTKKPKQVVAAQAKQQPISTQAQASNPKSLASASATSSPGGDEEADEDEDLGEDQPGQSTARAAKRQRQRERRKMFRAEARAAAAAVAAEGASVADSNMNAVLAEAQLGALESATSDPVEKSEMIDEDLAPCPDEKGVNRKNEKEDATTNVASNAEAEPLSPAGSVEKGVDTARGPDEQVEPHVLQVLRAQVEHLERSLAEGRTSKQSKGVRGAAHDKAKLQAPKKEQAKQTQKPSAAKADDKIELKSTEESKEGGSQPPSQLGVGRGTPLFVQSTPSDMFAGPGGGRSGGRGRAMPGPMAMQQRRLQAPPGGLSQPWMPAPAIPEEDDEESDISPNMSAHVKQMNPAFVIPSHSSALINGSLTPKLYPPTPSGSVSPFSISTYRSSAQTPQRMWPGTPSPPGTPCEPLPPAGIDMLPPSALPPASMSSFGGFPGSVTAGMPPTYVWVPLALAHCCPHCGGTFAMPPGGASGDNTTENSSQAGSDNG